MNQFILKFFKNRADLALHFTFSMAGTMAIYCMIQWIGGWSIWASFAIMLVIGGVKEMFDEVPDFDDVLFNFYGCLAGMIFSAINFFYS
jgi:uncharacterized paraquat-inducible protein A